MIRSSSLIPQSVRATVLAGAIHLYLTLCNVSAEDKFETRYQWYQEDDDRIRVDSDYSLFSVDLSDTLVLDGTFLYSVVSGASPIGIPAEDGGDVPVVNLEDERWATSFSLTKSFTRHALRVGASYSYEPDYLSLGASLQDTIYLNNKNTELVLGLAYTHDNVGAAGSSLDETKRVYDFLVGVNQVIDARTLFQFNVGLSKKQGFLSDPYKRVLIDDEIYFEQRPGDKLEQIVLAQLTRELIKDSLSAEVSYRFGHNDHGSISHTAMVSLYKYLFNKRVVIRPSFRFYDQSAADYYATEFSGDPLHYSSDYRLSAEQTFNYGLQIRWNVIPDKLALDLGYERYISRGTDGVTHQSAYPDANSVTVGVKINF